ncbi:MAG TPA: ABC transporter substrate-binding protein [Ktedonobacteraceae bacterium]|nr:ABC transporter substrate-binding protein [Ktedonobacteraceae bacterium]
MADRLGQQLGNYRLVSLLGQGGFAEVYLGQHVRLELQAAIKVLHTHLTASEVEHFSQEAQTIAKLTHPSIVRVFDYDVQDGVPFLVMDYAPGGSLRRRYPKGSVIPLSQIVSYVRQVAAGLQYAHDQKFIHRDVKPENMLLGRHEEVLLSDFGLAALAHSSGSLSTQEAIGTISYMAPEQIEGHPRAASDQYALGVVVYEWLCGQRPFEGSATEVMVQQLSVPPPPLHEKVATISADIEQVVLKALNKDPKERFASVREFAQAVERASQQALSPGMRLADESPLPGLAIALATRQEGILTEATPSVDMPTGAFDPTIFPDSSSPAKIDTPQSRDVAQTPMAAALPHPLEPTTPVQRKTRRLSGRTAALLIGLLVVVIAGGVLGSLSLLAHFGVLGAHSNAPAPVRGGTWTDDFGVDPNTLIPDTSYYPWAVMAQQALYLPLFYGDVHGGIHPGAATEIPTIQNGEVSADATTWTFHLRPHLLWSDGQPYDARDVAFTWRLMLNPNFYYNGPIPGLDPASSVVVSTDNLSITFHLKQPYAPFLALWVDGYDAPLPAHHFNSMTPEAILKSPDLLNPKVVSGPFMMSESVPGDHYTLVRNPRYYLASKGLPYLDKVIIRVTATPEVILKDLQAGSIDSHDDINSLDISTNPQAFQRFNQYTLITSPTSSYFLGLFFNFANTVLATHPEVRAAMAMAIDHQALIATVVHGFAEPICTDHGSFYHPGYELNYNCPPFDPAAANKLLDDNGWVKGPDGVRTKGKQRLEFELSSVDLPVRVENEVIVQHDLSVIGIKFDIQNYGSGTFFGSFLSEAKASPPTGAVAGRNDIAEYATGPNNYDPDDSLLLPCDQYPSYCNPALDALYKQELETADPGVRQQIFHQIHDIYLTDFPFIPLYFPLDVTIVRKGTHNYQPSPFSGETVNIWEWWCDNGKC